MTLKEALARFRRRLREWQDEPKDLLTIGTRLWLALWLLLFRVGVIVLQCVWRAVVAG